MLAKWLIESLVGYFLDMVVDAHSVTKFHHQMYVCSLVDDFVQFHNVRVPQIRKGVNLSMNSHLSLFVLQVLLVVCLDCNDVFGLLVLCSPYDGESTLTNLKIYLEILHV